MTLRGVREPERGSRRKRDCGNLGFGGDLAAMSVGFTSLGEKVCGAALGTVGRRKWSQSVQAPPGGMGACLTLKATVLCAQVSPTRASHSQIVQNSLSCALLRCALPALDANES